MPYCPKDLEFVLWLYVAAVGLTAVAIITSAVRDHLRDRRRNT